MATASFALFNPIAGRRAAVPPPPLRVSAFHATAERGGIAAQTASFYDVLGIRAGATCQEIKSAYRRLARVVHPDASACDDGGGEFMRVHAAYATLSDPERREAYDRSMMRRPRAAALTEADLCAAAGAAAAAGRRRTWETDQCW